MTVAEIQAGWPEFRQYHIRGVESEREIRGLLFGSDQLPVGVERVDYRPFPNGTVWRVVVVFADRETRDNFQLPAPPELPTPAEPPARPKPRIVRHPCDTIQGAR